MILSFDELAERELNDAAPYYDHEQAGLGAAFIADVRRGADAILAHPEVRRRARSFAAGFDGGWDVTSRCEAR